MIPCNDLRFDNWATGSVRPDEPMQIKSIDTTICKLGEYLEDYKNIHAIPLTPAILEKFGFVTVTQNKEGSYNFWNKEADASIDVDGDNIFLYRIHETQRRKSITSVHELQNLYHSLTGTELTIEL